MSNITRNPYEPMWAEKGRRGFEGCARWDASTNRRVLFVQVGPRFSGL